MPQKKRGSRRTRIGYRDKVYDKDKEAGTMKREIERYDRRIDDLQAAKAKLEAELGSGITLS